MSLDIRLLVLDVDGIMTDGKLWFLPSGKELKCFHVHDGLGIKQLMKAGIDVAVISARGCNAVKTRCDQLGITRYWLQQANKMLALNELKDMTGIAFEHMAYMGDDLADLKPLQTVGFPITVPNAVAAIKAVAKHQTTLLGGHGAVREAAEFILEQTGKHSA